MIIDLHTHLGHFPFRRLRNNTADQLLELMDQNGIDGAVVSSLNSVFYRNAHEGNKELKAETASAPNRFIPLATVNPTYADWRHDMDQAIQHWGWKGVYLVPEYHHYQLTSAPGQAVLRRIAECHVPVAIPQRLEDRRQQHWLDMTKDMAFAELLEAVRPFPDLKIILLNWRGLDGRKMRDAGLKGRVLIDFTRQSIVLRKDVSKLIDTLGVESIAFGSHTPMGTPAPALVRLEMLRGLSAEDRERIAWRNTARFLGLKKT